MMGQPFRFDCGKAAGSLSGRANKMPAREVWQDAEAARRIGVVKVLWKIELGRKALCGVPLCELLKLIGEYMGNTGFWLRRIIMIQFRLKFYAKCGVIFLRPA